MQNNKTYIIAEAGVNHNGDVGLAHQLLDKAFQAAADCIKFQTFKSDLLCSESAGLADYQNKNTAFSSQKEMLKTLELPFSAHFELQEEAKNKKLDFLSTPFDLVSLRFLVDDLGLKRIKVSSGDLTNLLLLYEAAYKDVDVIISTGMARLGDIELALASLAWGYKKLDHPKSTDQLIEILSDDSIYDLLANKVKILHCTSSYPANFRDINLQSICTLQRAFNCSIGYSDHTIGIEASIAAVALGAEIIEKHFTLDKTMEGPDHKASLDFLELKEMITSIRNVELALGYTKKHRLSIEQDIFEKAQKRVLASSRISKGQLLSAENLVMKRNSNGQLASNIWNIIGKKSDKDYKKDEAVI